MLREDLSLAHTGETPHRGTVGNGVEVRSVTLAERPVCGAHDCCSMLMALPQANILPHVRQALPIAYVNDF